MMKKIIRKIIEKLSNRLLKIPKKYENVKSLIKDIKRDNKEGINSIEKVPNIDGKKYNGIKSIYVAKYIGINGGLDQEIYFNRKGFICFENKPSMIGLNGEGTIIYEAYFDGFKTHNLNGPAFIRYNENGDVIEEKYYIDGIKYSSEFEYMIKLGLI